MSLKTSTAPTAGVPDRSRATGRFRSPLWTAVTTARWAGQHGVARIVIGRARRAGDLHAMILSDPRVRADPFPTYDRVRAAGPVAPGRLMFTTAHHEVALAALRSDRFGVGFDTSALPWLVRRVITRAEDSRVVGPIDTPSLLVTNPPDHTRYRRMVSRVFTARAVEALRDRVEEVADELLDQMAAEAGPAGQPVDLVGRYASLLPVTVIAEVLGVPLSMREQFLAWGSAAAPVLDLGLTYREYYRSEGALKDLNEWLYGHFERLRERPGDDIVSQLVQLADEQGKLTPRELMAIAMLLLVAGFETTVNLLGNGTVTLLEHPDQVAELRADPSGWANAVEEILRYDSPVQNTLRRTLVDTEIAGVDLPAGSFLVVLLGGANRDPAVFEDPDRFDIHRVNARDHLAFSSGAHYCVGASLARLEGEIGLRRLFERFGDLALAGPPTRRSTRTLRGYTRIPVTLGRTGAT